MKFDYSYINYEIDGNIVNKGDKRIIVNIYLFDKNLLSSNGLLGILFLYLSIMKYCFIQFFI